MKKFIFLLLSAILSMAVSANQVQNVKLPKPDQNKVRHTMTVPRADFSPSLRNATPQLAEAVVTPPADLETQGFRMNAYIFDGSSW